MPNSLKKSPGKASGGREGGNNLQGETRKELETLARQGGARLFGVAGVDRFEGAPAGHHPSDLVDGAASVVAVGVPVPQKVSNYWGLFENSEIIAGEFRRRYLQEYFYRTTGYDIINRCLEQVLLSLCLHLEDCDFPSLYFPPTYGGNYLHIQEKVPGLAGPFSLRHAAVRAGLGEFGLNNLVVTPEYGSRVRFGALVTPAPLEPTPYLSEKACLGLECKRCLEECRVGALALDENFDAGEVWLDPVSRTNITECRQKRVAHFCHGRCMAACP